MIVYIYLVLSQANEKCLIFSISYLVKFKAFQVGNISKLVQPNVEQISFSIVNIHNM